MDLKYICIGKIKRPQGVKGDLRLSVITDNSEDITKIKTIFIGDNFSEHNVEKCYKVSSDFGVSLKGINRVEEALKYKDCFVYALREDMDKLKKKDTFYIADLIGKTAVFEDGEVVGDILDIQNFGSSDVVYIKSDKRKNLCFANVGGIFKSIDYQKNKVVLNKTEFEKVSVSD